MKTIFTLIGALYINLSFSQCNELYQDFYLKLDENTISQIPNFYDSGYSINYTAFYTNRYKQNIFIQDSIRIKKPISLSLNDSFSNDFKISNNTIKFGVSGNDINDNKIEILVIRINHVEIYFSSFFGCNLKKLVANFITEYLTGSDKEELLNFLR
jgi:hypothetical protein